MIPPRRPSPQRFRYLLMLIVLLLVGGVVALAYRKQSVIVPSNTNANTTENRNVATTNTNATNTATAKLTDYANTEFGFSLSYPATWTVETNENGEGESRVVNFQFGNETTGVTLIVLSTSMEGIVRESVSILSESSVTINGQTAAKISAATAKDGSPIALLLFHKGATLYDLNGPADLVDSIGATFHFTSP